MYRHIPQVVTDGGIQSFANSVVPDVNTQPQHTQHQIWADQCCKSWQVCQVANGSKEKSKIGITC